MMRIEQLIYVSDARLASSSAASELAQIVAISASRNAAAGITGALMHHDGRFIQVLEGSPAALDILLLHLHFDSRHDNIRVLARADTNRRDFERWAMIEVRPTDELARTLPTLWAERTADLSHWIKQLNLAVTA